MREPSCYDRWMLVEVWSDMVCPWCYIGKRRLEAALARFQRRDRTRVVWRSFELDPDADGDPGTPLVDVLATKYGGGPERARAMMAHVTAVAAEEGLTYRLDRARRGNSFDAHRLSHAAHTLGLQEAFVERCMRAYFTEGVAIGDREALVALAREAGLDPGAAREALEGGAFADDVRRDEEAAHRIGVTGVPCFVVDRRLALAGAHPADAILGLLRRGLAREEAPSNPTSTHGTPSPGRS